jgi:hypothetical protein
MDVNLLLQPTAPLDKGAFFSAKIETMRKSHKRRSGNISA